MSENAMTEKDMPVMISWRSFGEIMCPWHNFICRRPIEYEFIMAGLSEASRSSVIVRRIYTVEAEEN